MKPFKRIMVIVLDSVGAGAAPDAASFNDVGSDTIGHVAGYTIAAVWACSISLCCTD